jgi:GTP cyclohydrolase I
MEHLIRELLTHLGEDPDRPGLEKTPVRMANALRELTAGYGEDARKLMSDGCFASDSTGMVLIRNVDFVSMCEHHVLPFIGQATIGFLPDGSLVGISKLVRLLEVFSRRLQVQERMGQQILDVMEETLNPLGALVHIEAKHLCMVARGVKQPNATMVTTHTSGRFREDAALVTSVLKGGA